MSADFKRVAKLGLVSLEAASKTRVELMTLLSSLIALSKAFVTAALSTVKKKQNK